MNDDLDAVGRFEDEDYLDEDGVASAAAGLVEAPEPSSGQDDPDQPGLRLVIEWDLREACRGREDE